MEMEFTKLSEVPVTDNPTDEASVLVEESGEIKRTPKSAIGAQADWNETDETKSSFIVNKPEKLGGVRKFFVAYENNYIFETDDYTTTHNVADLVAEKAVTAKELEDAFMNATCLYANCMNGSMSQRIGHIIFFAPYTSEACYIKNAINPSVELTVRTRAE